MLVTKIVPFDWLAVFEGFQYEKFAPIRAAFYLTLRSIRRCVLFGASFWYKFLKRNGWLGGVVVRSRTSDSEVAGSSPTRTAVE